MRIRSAAISDTGIKREINEDYYAIDNQSNLYIVADGMGGNLAGNVASEFAVRIIRKNIKHWIANDTDINELFGFPDNSLSINGNYILSGIKLANRILYYMSEEYKRYKGMGTTVAVLNLMPASVIAANVGDTKIYLIRGDNIETISKDHTMVSEQYEMGIISKEEAKASPLRHILTRNLGSSYNVNVDIFEIEPMENDCFLLCTDGLTDLVSNSLIFNIVRKGGDPEHLCNELIYQANNKGGLDNITVSMVFLDKLEKRKKK